MPRRGSRVRSPSRALANKKGYPSGYPFLLSRSAMHFSNACCFAARVRFLGTLKRPSVVPKPRSTGPCGTRLALLLLKRISVWISFFYYREVRCTSLTHAVLQKGFDFSGALKRPSVVHVPRSTGPCGTRLALLSKRAATLI